MMSFTCFEPSVHLQEDGSTCYTVPVRTTIVLKMNPRVRNMYKTPQIKILIYKICTSLVYIV